MLVGNAPRNSGNQSAGRRRDIPQREQCENPSPDRPRRNARRPVTAEEERLRAGLRTHSFLQQAAQVELRLAELASPALAYAAELSLQPLLDDPRLLT
jgi:hypothetical protein